MINSEIDTLYAPSKWSKREQVSQQHIDFATEASKKSREQIPCELNISYGEREREKYDIYGTDLPDSSPIFIFVHGGYWQKFSKNESSYAAPSLYKHKIKTIVIGYSQCPNVTIYDIVQEIERAMKACIVYAKTCGSRGIYLLGYSAGAQLVACLFSNLFPTLSQEEQNIFKAVILCSGVYDLTPLVLTSYNAPLKLTHEDAKNLSPMFYNVPALNFPVHIVAAENDSPAFIEQSQQYFNNIKPVCKANFKVIKDTDHFSIIEKMKDDSYEIVKFITDMEN
ncbi:Kynurenine formamidase [Carabus blaptoides fortunei]